jgi:serine O-acetyltransferase
MNIKKLLKPTFWLQNARLYRELIDEDYKYNAAFRGHNGKLPREFLNSPIWKFQKIYRKYLANQRNAWRSYYRWRLKHIADRTGLNFEGNRNMGKQLIIGHQGTIVVNGNAIFGDRIFITHNVTIGRDIRGKRAGVPKIGNDVVIRTNTCISGNITIGDDVLIAPNTFVNFDVPSHSIVIGNPAKIIPCEHATKGHLPVKR